MNAPTTIEHSRLSALIGAEGDRAARRFLEFFVVNIRNRNTRAAYARAAATTVGSRVSIRAGFGAGERKQHTGM